MNKRKKTKMNALGTGETARKTKQGTKQKEGIPQQVSQKREKNFIFHGRGGGMRGSGFFLGGPRA